MESPPADPYAIFGVYIGSWDSDDESDAEVVKYASRGVKRRRISNPTPGIVSTPNFMQASCSIHNISDRPVIRDEEKRPYFSPSLERGVGEVFPAKFVPSSPGATPEDLFPPGISVQPNGLPVVRFLQRGDPSSVLVYTDGACLHNGHPHARAGFAIVYRPMTEHLPGVMCARLEKLGPFGQEYRQTSNRAELRAVLGALRLRDWAKDGFKRLIVATDSRYVVQGGTDWIQRWLENGWKTHTGAEVKNRDMWELLLGEAERYARANLEIQFWQVSRDLNKLADKMAIEVGVKYADKHYYGYESQGGPQFRT
ncbi:Ribonuclease H-like protein [Moelleriella libera RCEF 2490]|uniref:ribonuclease H n=1 Tax=Moelleriella libera RCEF 2490 TaxID=1081109 RepID=A0A167WF85_9HYPO|nr:Ribonuclease H-like protein [Moelleriella libera RCEF 2490]